VGLFFQVTRAIIFFGVEHIIFLRIHRSVRTHTMAHTTLYHIRSLGTFDLVQFVHLLFEPPKFLKVQLNLACVRLALSEKKRGREKERMLLCVYTCASVRMTEREREYVCVFVRECVSARA